MSETFSRHRGLDLRGQEPVTASSERLDPLAELARLVGRDDPFRDLFHDREKLGQKPVSRPAQVEARPSDSSPYHPYSSQPTHGSGEQPDGLFAAPEHADIASDGTEDAVFHAPLGQVARDSFRLPAYTGSNNFSGAGERGGHFEAEHSEAPELNADLWAQGMPETASAEPLHFEPEADAGADAGGSQRRTVVVLLAVLALTLGGLGATFLVRNGGAGNENAGELPTIMADTAPTKVQPPDTSNQSTGGDGNTALIEKSASDNVSNAKVVNTQEQPVDLSQLPQAPPATNQAIDSQVAVQPNDGRVATAKFAAGSSPSPFPEPHRVKTVLIRPDGSVVGEDQAAPAPQNTIPAQADATTPVARPSTPKTPARASSTPKSATPTAEGTAAAKPKPVHTQPKPAPVQTAAAEAPVDATASTATAGAAGAAGAFAVQLAAPGTEQEAKDISARLQKKFSAELGGRAPSVRKADKGDKSVYRVRVSNLSQDDARTLCTKLQAGGGSCFVVRN